MEQAKEKQTDVVGWAFLSLFACIYMIMFFQQLFLDHPAIAVHQLRHGNGWFM